MAQQTTSTTQGEIENIGNYVERSYLNYSMYVIMDRALPHIGDGLKPVQRRLLYAMSELNLDFQSKYKKSARTVGDTLGKYHPHGDSACYEAMVLMAQPFTTLYPLVDGQGNWGSNEDPKSFAAMRYTESKMTRYSNSLLNEIKLDTVDWKLNFDGTMKEPCLLPAQLPNIILNGTTGIAVGMATDIPPHNMKEVIAACVATLNNSEISDDEILSHITIPDFPSGGVVTSTLDKVHAAYRTGNGVITLRGTIEQESDVIYITSVPYRMAVSKLIISINDEIKDKKLPVTRMRNHSSETEPVRLALYVSGYEAQELVLQTLYANTNLELSVKINLNMIGIDGRPQVKPLPIIIKEWCEYRQIVFERKTNFRLRAVNSRLHILEGLILAHSNIDEILSIIRTEDDPKLSLIEKLGLSEIQAQSILDLRLRQLAKLEERSLRDESANLENEKGQIEILLASDKKIKDTIIQELLAAAAPHFSERVTIHCPVTKKNLGFTINNTSPQKENITVVLSKNHWIRTVKGHDVDLSKLSYKVGDDYGIHLNSDSASPVILMGDHGRFFGVPIDSLPNGKSNGEPLTSKVSFQDGEQPHTIIPYQEDSLLLLTTSKGLGFIAPVSTLDSRAKKGKPVLVLTQGDKAMLPLLLNGETELAILTKHGRLSIIPISSINVSNKSQGTRLIDVKPSDFANGSDEVTHILLLHPNESFFVKSGLKKGLFTEDKKAFYRAARGRRGVVINKDMTDLSLERAT
jgi:topoisomerase-4 subunit A